MNERTPPAAPAPDRLAGHIARYRFATPRSAFEFDPHSLELWVDGGQRKLGPQPAQLLRLLLEANGSLVLREHIWEELWPDATVEFDHGLHACVSQLRRALGDSARDPQLCRDLAEARLSTRAVD